MLNVNAKCFLLSLSCAALAAACGPFFEQNIVVSKTCNSVKHKQSAIASLFDLRTVHAHAYIKNKKKFALAHPYKFLIRFLHVM